MAIAPLATARADVGISAGGLVAMYAKKKKKKKKKPAAADAEPAGPLLTPESAETKRQAIRDAAKGDLESGDLEAAADTLAKNAAELGDPITMLEAGEAGLTHADKVRSKDAAETALERTRTALDILEFYAAVDAGQATSDWLVVAPSEISGHIDRANSQIEKAEELIAAIDAENESVAATDGDGKGKAKKKKRKRGEAKPGTVMIAAGSIFTAIGITGIPMVAAGLAISSNKQKEVEKLQPGDPKIRELDKEGSKGNLLAYLGAGFAAGGLAIGLPLLILGIKKRKKAGDRPPSAAHLGEAGRGLARAEGGRRGRTNHELSVAPMFGGAGNGLLLRGRF